MQEEYFNKCMAILEIMEAGEGDTETLAWIAKDYLELLGEAIGIVQKK